MLLSKGLAVSYSVFVLASIALYFGWVARASAAGPSERAELLVAKPQNEDPVFGTAIVLVKPMKNGGHLGFILNKPTTATLGQLFPEHEPSKKIPDPLYLGGPEDMNLVFALVERHGGGKKGALQIAPDLFLEMKAEAVDRIIENEAEHARFFLGMVVWAPGELDDEIGEGLWYEAEADEKLVFRKKTDGMWEELVRRSQMRANAI
jgi:putative transcriptional regulator